jgi:hypothetical protein
MAFKHASDKWLSLIESFSVKKNDLIKIDFSKIDDSVFVQDEIAKSNFLSGRGELVLNNIFQYGNFDPKEILGELSWDENPYGDPTWEWLHHQLTSIEYLIASYLNSKETRHIEKAVYLLRSWSESNSGTREFTSKLAWNDHSSAYRLKNLIILSWVMVKNNQLKPEDIKFVFDILFLHIKVLAEDDFYSEHTNHGLDQSYFLYQATKYLEKFIEFGDIHNLALKRLISEIKFMFSDDGVHVENSPSYHIWITKKMLEIAKLIEFSEKDAIDSAIKKALNFIKHILKPDLTHPMIGDSQKFKIDLSYIYKQYIDSELEYVLSGGLSGSKPKEKYGLFLNGGYIILRNAWIQAGDEKNLVHFVFKNSHKSDYHRQDDDLNFVLYAYGEDFLVDAGRFGYLETSKNRIFARSALAHNVPYIQNHLPIRHKNILKFDPIIRVDEYSDNVIKFYSESYSYNGFTLARSVKFNPPHSFEFLDEISSSLNENFNWYSNFIIPYDKDINYDKGIVKVEGRNSIMTIQIIPYEEIEIQTEIIEISLSDNSIEKAKRLFFLNSGKSINFYINFLLKE